MGSGCLDEGCYRAESEGVAGLVPHEKAKPVRPVHLHFVASLHEGEFFDAIGIAGASEAGEKVIK